LYKENIKFLKPPEETDEDAPPVVNSKWIVRNTQKQSNLFEPNPEDLFEKDTEKNNSNFVIIVIDSYLDHIETLLNFFYYLIAYKPMTFKKVKLIIHSFL